MVAVFTGLGAGFTRGSANLLGGAGQVGSGLLGRAGESVSVNAATGGLVLTHQDEFLIGKGPDVALSRTYNSITDASGGDRDNGDNWQQSTTRRVFGLTGTLNTAGSTVSRLGGDGAVVVYAWDSSRSAYLTKDGSGAFDTLTKVGAEWVWTDGDSQGKEYYEAAQTGGEFRIRASEDTDGNALSFTYVAGTDKLDKVTTADGSWTQYSWSGNNVTQIVTGYTDLGTSTAKTLTRVRYGYDGSNRLITVTTDLTPGDNSVSDNNTYIVTYSYDGSSNRIASITQTDGSQLAVTYDGSGRVSTLTQTIASGVTRITTLSYGSGYTTITGPDSQVTRLDYDGSGRLTKITAPPAFSGAAAQTVEFAYDADGNLDTVTDGAGKVTSYDYDANGNATLITDATGNTVQRTYDAANRLITEYTQGADRDGASIAHYRQYVYDSEGHLRFAVNAAGQTTEYRYGTAGDLLRTIQYVESRMTPPGASAITLATAEAWVTSLADKSSVRIVENTYDVRGNVTQTRSFGIASTAGEPLTGEGTTTASFVYDQAGRLIERYRPGENHETFLYDGMGRIYSSTDRNGGTTTIVFSDATTTTTVTTAAGFSTVSVYNKAGELVSATESGTNVTVGTATYVYDAAGRLRAVNDASGRSSFFYYDKAGRKVATANELGEVTEYRYDSAGRIIASISYATALGGANKTAFENPASTADFSTLRPTSNAADIWNWTVYDDAGRVLQSIDNLGSTVTYQYDTEGKLTQTTAWFNRLTSGQLNGFRTSLPTAQVLPSSHAKDTVSRVFYNKAGQQIGTLDGEGYLSETIRDGTGAELYTTYYAAITNAADRASGSFGTLKAGIATSTADRVNYSVYDGQGLLRYSINARGGVVGYTYDDAGRLVTTTAYATEFAFTDYTYDAVKALVAANGADRVSSTVYDAAGRAAYTVDAEGGVVAFSYNNSGWVTKAVAYDNAYSGTKSLSALNSWAANSSQANDGANRISRNWYNAGGEVIYSLDAENYATGYAYDQEGRVLSTTRYGGSGLTVSDATTVSQLQSLLAGVPTTNAITVSQTYDDAGRVVTVTTPTEGAAVTVTRNVYNALGQLVEVIEADNDTALKVTTRYTYDGVGRVLTVTNAYGTADAATVTYAYDGLGNRTSVTDPRGNATSYTYDRMGRVLTATDALSGVMTYVYDAFGQVVKVTDPRGKSTYNYYDRLGRLVTVRDPLHYVTHSFYNRFGEVTTVKRYATAFTGTPQIGVNPTGNPDGASSGPSPAVIAAYAYAAQLQADADTAAAALAAEQAALAATIAAPLPFLQDKLAALQAQRAVVQAQYNSANWFDKLFVYGPQLTAIDSDINKVNTNITRVNNNQGLDSWGTSLVNSAYNVGPLQTAYNNAQAAADNALADAQALEAAEQGGGDYGPFAGTTYTYNRLGQVATKIDAEGNGESYTYNAFGQLVTFRRYQGAITGSNYNQTSFEYDRRGSLTKSTDAQSHYEAYTYDAFGNRISYKAKSANTVAAQGGTTTYTYDKRGLLLTEILPIQSYNFEGEHPITIMNKYSYDLRGNLTQKIEAHGLDEARATNYAYDKLNRLTTTTSDAYEKVASIAANRVLTLQSTVAATETITYDKNGNVTKTVDAAGTVTIYFYDALNRKTAEVVRSDPANNKGILTTYAYDANGNTTNIKIYESATVTITASSNGGTSSAAPSAPAGDKRETTFTYDDRGQMLTSDVVLPSGYKTGTWNGSSWTNVTTTALTTSYQYDYLGNVVKLTDPNGNATFSYYDKLARKTAQLDAEGYLSTWAYDSEGNVVAERRYNARFTGTPSTANPPSLSANAADRVTEYTYDKVGNRLTETRLGVVIHNGTGGTTTTSSQIIYTYNGLGQVLTKTEATNDQITYLYDAGGRLTQETRTSYTSFGSAVTPQVKYFYNGLGNLVRSEVAGAGDAAARYTTYEYGTGGRLRTMTDAEGGVREYYYDTSGRLVLEYYQRATINTSGSQSTVTEGIGYRYDALGRNIGQAFYTSTNPTNSWSLASGADWTSVEYNSFGDVVKTGVNGILQQENQYDLAGRLWATNSGDGIWKYFGYDKNGNQTVAITSAGDDLAGKTFNSARTMISGAGTNGTYTVYDKRNLATSVVEEGRQLSDSTTQTLTSSRTYNAFGEVSTETNAASATVTYAYNTMGRVTRIESPTVQITMEDGTTRYVKPSEDFYYDKSGRLVAKRDANGTYGSGGTSSNGASKGANTGNLTRLELLKGTGYGGTEALVTKQTNADGGITEIFYDIHGDARSTKVLIDGTTWTETTQSFDRLGRLIKATRPGGSSGGNLVDSYAYDQLGRLIEHGNSAMSTLNTSTQKYLDGNTEITVYDIQGRVTATRGYGAFITENTYEWVATFDASGTGSPVTGGWRQTTSYKDGSTSIGRTLVEETDFFGRSLRKVDLGGYVTLYTYDLAGRLIQAETTVGSNTGAYKYEYYNTGQVKKAITSASVWTAYYYYDGYGYYDTWSQNTVTDQTAVYTYDAVGNRLTEYGTTVVNGSAIKVFKNQTATYDALGRLKSIASAANDATPDASTAFTYDANGNIRSKTESFRPLSDVGAADATLRTQENWFLYDSMNRVVLNNGTLSNGAIIRRPAAHEYSAEYLNRPPLSQSITYDKAGQRTSVAVTSAYYEQYGTYIESVWETKEIYKYDSAGRLIESWEVTGTATSMPTQAQVDSPTPATGTGVKRSAYTYDAMGRQLTQIDYGSNGTTAVFSRTITYNTRGQIYTDYTSTLRWDGKTATASTTNNYGSGTAYALGAVVSATTINSLTGTSTLTASTTNTFTWRDSALQSYVSYDSNINSSSNPVYGTTFTYNPLGQMTSAYIQDGMARTVTFSLDEIGQIIRRDETKPSNAPASQAGSPHEIWYRFGEREWGYVGNNGTTDGNMAQSISARQSSYATQGTFRNGSISASTAIDFTRGIDPLNSYDQGSRSGSYTVRNGDTLQAIAQRLYGDAQLWYKIAEVNGLSGASGLIAGQQLTLPAGVVRNTYNASTYNPYDPAQAIGDLSPTTPAPPKKAKCGFLGQLLLVVVAAAVTILAGPTIVGAFQGALGSVAGAIVGGAVVAATSSIASQTVGVITGIQEKFSWKSVGIAALTAFLGPVPIGKIGGSAVAGAMVGSALTNAAVQGVAVGVGLQDKFSWAGVAAAAAAAGAGTAFGNALGAPKSRIEAAAQDIAVGAASGIASAATRSAIEGSNFGANLAASLPDVIGQVLGRALGDALSGAISSSTKSAIAAGAEPDSEAISSLAETPESINLPTSGENVSNYIYVYSNRKNLLDNYNFNYAEVFSHVDRLLVWQMQFGSSRIINSENRRNDSSIRAASDNGGASPLTPRNLSHRGPDMLLSDDLFVSRQVPISEDAGEKIKEILRDGVDLLSIRAVIDADVGHLIGGSSYTMGSVKEWSEAAVRVKAGGDLPPVLVNYQEKTSWAERIRAEFLKTEEGTFLASYIGVDGDHNLLAQLAAENPEAAALGEYGSYIAGVAGLVKGLERKAVTEGLELFVEDSPVTKQALLAAVRRTRSLSEAKGVVYASREADRLGFELIDTDLRYRGGHGIDLAFVNPDTGRYAVWEAKGGFTQRTLSALSTDRLDITQGSLRFIETRLQRYIRYGDGAHVDVARNLQGALDRGNIDSFVSLYGSRRTYQLPLDGSGIRPANLVP